MRTAAIVIFFVSILFLIWSFYDYAIHKQNQVFDSAYESKKVTEILATKLDSTVFLASILGTGLVGEIERGGLVEEDLRLMIAEAGENPYIKGITVAYEPYQFDSDLELFNLTYDNAKSDFVENENPVDYRDTADVSNEWYTIPAITNEVLLQTTFADNKNELTLESSVPFFWKNDYGIGQFIGVMKVDLGVDIKTTQSENIPEGVGLNTVLLDEYYGILANSNPNMEENAEFSDILGQLGMANQLSYLEENEAGYLNFASHDGDVRTTVYFMESVNTGWKLATIVTQVDLLQRNLNLEEKKMNAIIAAVISLLLLIVLWYNYYQRKNRDVIT